MMKIAYTALLGTALTEERATKKMTQSEIAMVAGLTQSAWARLEQGKGWTIENLYRACKAFELEPWQLIKVVDDRANALRAQGHEVHPDTGDAEDDWVKGNELTKLAVAALAAATPVGLVSGLIAGGIAEYITRQLGANRNDRGA